MGHRVQAKLRQRAQTKLVQVTENSRNGASGEQPIEAGSSPQIELSALPASPLPASSLQLQPPFAQPQPQLQMSPQDPRAGLISQLPLPRQATLAEIPTSPSVESQLASKSSNASLAQPKAVTIDAARGPSLRFQDEGSLLAVSSPARDSSSDVVNAALREHEEAAPRVIFHDRLPGLA